MDIAFNWWPNFVRNRMKPSAFNICGVAGCDEPTVNSMLVSFGHIRISRKNIGISTKDSESFQVRRVTPVMTGVTTKFASTNISYCQPTVTIRWKLLNFRLRKLDEIASIASNFFSVTVHLCSCPTGRCDWPCLWRTPFGKPLGSKNSVCHAPLPLNPKFVPRLQPRPYDLESWNFGSRPHLGLLDVLHTQN
jgi:hypothetical protein